MFKLTNFILVLSGKVLDLPDKDFESLENPFFHVPFIDCEALFCLLVGLFELLGELERFSLNLLGFRGNFI